MRKYEHGEIAEIILSILLVAGIVAVAVTMPNALQLFKYFKPKDWRERSRINQSVNRLERRGLITRKGGGIILTSKGTKRATRYKIESMRIMQQKVWDRKWRLVMFDIPEERKIARRAVNHMLKRIGCAQYQKSVFITPFPCEAEIDLIGSYFGIRKYISLIIADKIEKESIFKEEFNMHT